jgi:hypothetical protein
VGGSGGNILQVFGGYVFALCLLIVVCASVIGGVIAGVVMAVSAGVVTANVGIMYNVVDIDPMVFIGFDPRILAVYLAVFGVGVVCILFVIGKLLSRDIGRDLRQ